MKKRSIPFYQDRKINKGDTMPLVDYKCPVCKRTYRILTDDPKKWENHVCNKCKETKWEEE